MLLLLVMQQLVLLVPLVLLPDLLKGSVIRLWICCVCQGYVPMLLVSQLMVQQLTHGLARGCGMLCYCWFHCQQVRVRVRGAGRSPLGVLGPVQGEVPPFAPHW